MTYYTLDAATSANFVLTCSGDYKDVTGSSRGISTEVDRIHLILLRRQADAVITDGATARVEDYTPRKSFETYIFTRDESVTNRLAFRSDADLRKIVDKIRDKHTHLLFETGPTLLRRLVSAEILETLFVSVVHTEACPMNHFEQPWIHELVREFLNIHGTTRMMVSTLGTTTLARFDFGVA